MDESGFLPRAHSKGWGRALLSAGAGMPGQDTDEIGQDLAKPVDDAVRDCINAVKKQARGQLVAAGYAITGSHPLNWRELLHSGVLLKVSPKKKLGSSNWQRRVLLLTPTVLIYCKSEDGRDRGDAAGLITLAEMSSIKVIPPLFDSEAEELQIGTESGRTFRFKHELDGSTSPGERLACNFELQWWCTKITGAKRNYSRNPESAQQNNSAAGSGGAPPPPPVGTPRASFSSSPVVEPIMKKTPLAAESVVSKTLPPASRI